MTGSPLVDDAAAKIFLDFVPNAADADVWDVNVGFDMNHGDRVPPGKNYGTMKMKKTDTSIDLAFWTDHTVIEAFWQRGRSYWTVPLSCDAVGNNTKQGISIYANATATVEHATVFAVNSIWA